MIDQGLLESLARDEMPACFVPSRSTVVDLAKELLLERSRLIAVARDRDRYRREIGRLRHA